MNVNDPSAGFVPDPRDELTRRIPRSMREAGLAHEPALDLAARKALAEIVVAGERRDARLRHFNLVQRWLWIGVAIAIAILGLLSLAACGGGQASQQESAEADAAVQQALADKVIGPPDCVNHPGACI